MSNGRHVGDRLTAALAAGAPATLTVVAPVRTPLSLAEVLLPYGAVAQRLPGDAGPLVATARWGDGDRARPVRHRGRPGRHRDADQPPDPGGRFAAPAESAVAAIGAAAATGLTLALVSSLVPAGLALRRSRASDLAWARP